MSDRESAALLAHRLTLRTMGGRNSMGLPVMQASCLCPWSHMTAYRFRRGFRGWFGARRYLRARYEDHLPPPGFEQRGASEQGAPDV